MHRMVSRPELCEPGAHAQPCVATQVDENPTPSILANMRTALGIWQGNGCWGGAVKKLLGGGEMEQLLVWGQAT